MSSIPEKDWDCIVNKTPLLGETNRRIGGNAPSVYYKGIREKLRELPESEIRARIASHKIDVDALIKNDFKTFFIARAKALLGLIESAMGKEVSDKASQQTIKLFGESLS